MHTTEKDTAGSEAKAALEAAKRAQEAFVGAGSELRQAQEKAGRCHDECGLLEGLRPPADLAEHVIARARAGQHLADADTRFAEAKSAVDKAREALATQPDGGALSKALTSATELREICATQLAMAPEHASRREQLAGAQARLERINGNLAAARAAAEEAERTDKALALRAHLVAGQPCPVCEQEVHVLPAHQPDPRISEAREAEAALNTERTRAESKVGELRAAMGEDTGVRANALALAERHRKVLSESAVVPKPPS
ncbi:hypothetical protein [Actinophytocola sp.]|uniref:hypothetical protein n=1 Tax=Actinophytocola sp. TaxID=1872138 RepID=UPI00389AA258